MPYSPLLVLVIFVLLAAHHLTAQALKTDTTSIFQESSTSTSNFNSGIENPAPMMEAEIAEETLAAVASLLRTSSKENLPNSLAAASDISNASDSALLVMNNDIASLSSHLPVGGTAVALAAPSTQEVSTVSFNSHEVSQTE